MKKILFLALASFAFINGVYAQTTTTKYKPLSAEEEASFEKQLNAAISKAEKNVQELQHQATRRDVAPMWVDKLELQNAIIQLEVKKTLVGNFKGTESLQSPAVRKMLIDVLNKPSISTGDLAELQSLVLDEKAKIRAEQSEVSPTPKF